MLKKQIEDEIIGFGGNLNDYVITNDGYTIKASHYQRKVAKEEDAPIVENVDIVAETVGISVDDTAMIAETVGTLLDIIANLEARIQQLEGGNV